MSINDINGRNLGTIWLSYMHYSHWTVMQPRTKSKCEKCLALSLYATSGPCLFPDQSSSNHRICSETAIQEQNLKFPYMCCAEAIFFSKCSECWLHVEYKDQSDGINRVGLPECAIVWPYNKWLSSGQLQKSHSLVLLQKPQKKSSCLGTGDYFS